jgi:hypothetical protein
LFNVFFKKNPVLLPVLHEDRQTAFSSFSAAKICLVFLILGSYLTFADLGFLVYPQNKNIIEQKRKDYFQSQQIPETIQTLLEEEKIRTLEGEIWYPVQTTGDENRLIFYSSAAEIIREIPVKLTLETSEKDIDLPDRSNAIIFQCSTQKPDTIKTLGIVILDTQPFQTIWDEEAISNCH